MEAEAFWGGIIKGISKAVPKVAKGMKGAGDDVAKGAKGLGDDPHALKPLKEFGDGFKEYSGLRKVGDHNVNHGGEIALEIKDSVQKYNAAKRAQQESDGAIDYSQEPNEIRFNELHDEKYRYNISTPEFWPPYNIKSSIVSLDPEYKTYNEIIFFTDEPDTITSDAVWYTGGFYLYIAESPLEISEISTNYTSKELEEFENMLIREMCDETATICSDFQIIESEITGEASYVQFKIKYSMKTRADADSQFIAVIQQFNIIFSDDFVYLLEFGNEKNKFAAYAVLYDHIDDSFSMDEPPDYFTTILLVVIGGLGIIIPFVIRRLRNKTQKLRDDSRIGEWEQDDESR